MTRRILSLLTPQQRQVPILEWGPQSRWRIWLAYSPKIEHGTYLDLYGTNPLDQRFIGQCERTTIGPDGRIVNITTLIPSLTGVVI